VSNKLQLQLQESNNQLEENSSAYQKEQYLFDRELTSINERLAPKVEETNQLIGRYDAEVTHHGSQAESLRSEHATQILVIETRGADLCPIWKMSFASWKRTLMLPD